jgi:hypothetical protein
MRTLPVLSFFILPPVLEWGWKYYIKIIPRFVQFAQGNFNIVARIEKNRDVSELGENPIRLRPSSQQNPNRNKI